MKKILLGLLVTGTLGGIVWASTNAFFSDTETSTGNILQAGALDLKIDNTCYYNGLKCDDGVWGGTDEKCSCTWESKDLGRGDVFFDLRDLKPGDWEEDTISIDVDNPSWLCADINVTRDADNSCTEPEQAAVGGENGLCVDPNGDGELAENLFFVFWTDDGDNVFETDEVNNILTAGRTDEVFGHNRWALADSEHGKPIGSDKTYYIGKFFCFGEIDRHPVDQDGEERVNSPTKDPGFTCDGKLVDNKSQTDSLEGDISFYAEQHRNNPDFLCNPVEVL